MALFYKKNFANRQDPDPCTLRGSVSIVFALHGIVNWKINDCLWVFIRVIVNGLVHEWLSMSKFLSVSKFVSIVCFVTHNNLCGKPLAH